MQLTTNGASQHALDVEAHVQPELEGDANLRDGGSARVKHIVIRINTFHSKIKDPTYADRIARIEQPIVTLPYLRTVTLETTDEEESTELVANLPLLHQSGKLRCRTCEQAQSTALEARRNPVSEVEDQAIVSPLWYSDRYKNDARSLWCVNVLFLPSVNQHL